jgi:tetratricopeptide (TPR) repeat protein
VLNCNELYRQHGLMPRKTACRKGIEIARSAAALKSSLNGSPRASPFPTPTATVAARTTGWGDYDLAIADLDKAIQLDPKSATAYNNRCSAYFHKGDNDRAITDCEQAIQLDPKYAAYNDRAVVYDAKGDYDRAIADYDEAIRLAPKIGVIHRNRGRVYFHRGDFTAAAANFLNANDLEDNAYAMILRFIARGRMGQDGTSELSANAARLKTKDWPYPVIDFYLGRRSLDELRAAASKPEEKCEVAFYVGEWQLLRGNHADAKTELLDAAKTCPSREDERIDAIVELGKL